MLKTTAFLFLGATLLAACSTPQSKARDAEDAQRKATEKGAFATEDARLDAEAAQRKVDQDKAAGARDSQETTAEAQAGADQKWNEAAFSLSKARTEAREDAEKKLATLETDAADVRRTLVKKLSQPDFAVLADDLTARSQAATASIRDLATATADTLESVKSTVALRLDEYGRAIAAAKRRN